MNECTKNIRQKEKTEKNSKRKDKKERKDFVFIFVWLQLLLQIWLVMDGKKKKLKVGHQWVGVLFWFKK